MGNTELKQWLKEYLRFKDIYDGEIKEIQDSKKGVEVIYEDRKERYAVYQRLADVDSPEDEEYICTQSSKENVDYLLSSWECFRKFSKLTIIFADPTANQKWVLKPYLHAKISDNPKKGIISLFQSSKGMLKEDVPRWKCFENSESIDEDEQ